MCEYNKATNPIEKILEEFDWRFIEHGAWEYSLPSDVRAFLKQSLTALYNQGRSDEQERILKFLYRVELGDYKTIVSYEEDEWRWWKDIRNTIRSLAPKEE